MLSAQEALQRLKEGNRRFVSGELSLHESSHSTRRAELIDSQEPFAVILGCSDSRVPAEIVFDVGLGELFVIRVAGNIAASTQMASIEFAVERFKTPLVVVLGHSGCGAVGATIAHLADPNPAGPDLESIVGRIRPAIEHLLPATAKTDLQDLTQQAVRANVEAVVDHIRVGSDQLRKLVEDEAVMIVGATYSLETGHVEFFRQ